MKSRTRKKLLEVCSVVFTTSLLLLLISGCATTAKQDDVLEKVTEVDTSEVEASKLLEEKRLKAEREAEEARRREAENRRIQQEKQRLEQERLRAEEERRRAEEEARMRAEVVPITTRKDAEDAAFLKDIRFEYDKADITSAAAETLQNSAEWLMQNADVKILIEGHCDEKGTNEYNISLGDRRALSVKRYLMSLGISGGRVSTISYGEEMPVDTGHTEEAMAMNRRAHFLVTSQ